MYYMDEGKLTTPECANCANPCCAKLPGIYAPTDFGDEPSEIRKKLRNAFASGRLTIDWFEGDPRKTEMPEDPRITPHLDKFRDIDKGLYVRPATKGNEGIKADPSWGGVCTFLCEKGCALSFKERPENCRRLMPVTKEGRYRFCSLDEDGCIQSKQLYALLWLPYTVTLKSLGNIKRRAREEEYSIYDLVRMF